MHSKDLISEEKALAKDREKLGQVQILVIFIFLLLMPTTVIIAQNLTINMTGDVIADVPAEELTFTEPPQDLNQTNTTDINTSGEYFEPTDSEPLNATEFPSNETEQNDTVIIPPENPIFEINFTINATNPNETDTDLPVNRTIESGEPITTEINDTINETTDQIESGIEEPELNVEISSMNDILRGNPFPVKVTVSNTGTGTAMNAVIYWILPDGIEILSGSDSHSCQNIPPESSCSSEIQAIASLSSLGNYEIMVRVNYNE